MRNHAKLLVRGIVVSAILAAIVIVVLDVASIGAAKPPVRQGYLAMRMTAIPADPVAPPTTTVPTVISVPTPVALPTSTSAPTTTTVPAVTPVPRLATDCVVTYSYVDPVDNLSHTVTYYGTCSQANRIAAAFPGSVVTMQSFPYEGP